MKPIKTLLFLILTISVIYSCSEDDSQDAQNIDPNLIVYKNQTGDVNADALQAQYKDSEGVLNIYGIFDSNLNPADIRTFTYQKVNNDTIVNFVFDPLTSKITSAFTSVNGIKSDVVIKFEYPDNSKVNVSFYQYDWSNQSAENILSVNLDASNFNRLNNTNSKNGSLLLNRDGNWSLSDWKLPLATGLLVAEAVGTVAGGFTLGFLSTAGAVLTSVAAAAIATPLVAIAGALAVAALIIPSDGFSSEIEPADIPYPVDTQILNPVPVEENPTPHLINPCENSNLGITLGVDANNEVTAIVNGSSGNYDFYWSTGDTATALISHTITAPDSDTFVYLIVVGDNGCSAFAQTNLEPSDPNNYEDIIIGAWSYTGLIYNGINYLSGCTLNLTIEFTINNEYIESYPSSADCPSYYELGTYIINGNSIDLSFQSSTASYTILNLNENELILRLPHSSGGYVYYTYERL